MTHHLPHLLLIAAALFTCSAAQAAQPEMPIWPGEAPGEKGDIGAETDTTKPTDNMVAGKRVARIGNVSKPTLTAYPAPKDKNTGAAVLVCPGGAYRILAFDLEGSEVCEWLNSIGVNAFLLKYRVPSRAGLEKHTAALQDAQRSLGLIRHRASEWGVDPKRVGVIGFSAGGHLSAALGASAAQRTYPVVDDADKQSCRPDFSMLIYPAYLMTNEMVAPSVAITSSTPPAFIAMSQDDPVGVDNALRFSLALKQAKVPFEVHVYPKGGHGYGLRRTENPLTAWNDRAAEWMKSQKLLENSK